MEIQSTIKVGTRLNFGKDKMGKIISMGDKIMTIEIIGKKKVKESAIDTVIHIGEVPFTIITAGKRFKVRRIGTKEK